MDKKTNSLEPGDVVRLPSDNNVRMTVLMVHEDRIVTLGWFDREAHFQTVKLLSDLLCPTDY
jgi:hypothetical protein